MTEENVILCEKNRIALTQEKVAVATFAVFFLSPSLPKEEVNVFSAWKDKKDKDKANALRYSRVPEALIMTTILTKVVFHIGVEPLFATKTELKSLNDTSLKRRAESANLPVKEVQEESRDNGWQFSIMGRRVQHLKRDPT